MKLLVFLCLGLLLTGTSFAAPPADITPNPELQAWFEALRQPLTKHICCAVSDCRFVPLWVHDGNYEVEIAMIGIMSCHAKRSSKGFPIPPAERWLAILSAHLGCPFPAAFLVINRKTPSRYFASFRHAPPRSRETTQQLVAAAPFR
jgi:hypothetical protein